MKESNQHMNRPKHIVEYLALRGFGSLVNRIPHRLALIVGWGTAFLIHHMFRFRVSIARQRIREVFLDRFSEKEIRKVAWISWRNTCLNAVDLLRMPSLSLEQIQQHIDGMHEVDTIRSVCDEGNGVVLAVPHSGCWDMAGVLCDLKGLPIFFIARRQKNPLTDDFINRMRGTSGIETVLNDSRMLRGVIRKLKEGKVLAMLPDVRSRTPSLSIEFLGGSANLGAGMAMFSRLTGAPILPAGLIREGWSHHRWKTFDPIRPDKSLDKKADWQRMTQKVLSLFNQFIREHPENYFWYSKRWVLDPLDPAQTASSLKMDTKPDERPDTIPQEEFREADAH